MLLRRLLGVLCLLTLALSVSDAAPLSSYALHLQRFRDWSPLQENISETAINQIWRHPIANPPKGSDGYLMVSYQVLTKDSPAEAADAAGVPLQRASFNDYVARGFVVTSSPWSLPGQHAVVFSIRGLSQHSVVARAEAANVYTLAFAQDSEMVLLQVSEVCSSAELDGTDRILKKSGGEALANELAHAILDIWQQTPEPDAAANTGPGTPSAPQSADQSAGGTVAASPTPTSTPATPPVPARSVVAQAPATATAPTSVAAPPTPVSAVAPAPAAVTAPTPVVAHPAPAPAVTPAPAAAAAPTPVVAHPAPAPAVTPASAVATAPTPVAAPPAPAPAVAPAPAPVTPDVPRWKTADGFLSLIVPDGCKVTGKNPYLFSGVEHSTLRLYPWDPYTTDAQRDAALKDFAETQQNIALKNFSQRACQLDGAPAVRVQFTNYAHSATVAYLFAKSGRLWQCEVTLADEGNVVPAAVQAMIDSIRVE